MKIEKSFDSVSLVRAWAESPGAIRGGFRGGSCTEVHDMGSLEVITRGRSSCKE